MKDKIHILIVEDEVIIALGTKSCLEGYGYVVDGMADNTKDALALVKQYSPNLVLMDIQLRGNTTGIEIVSIIQEKFKIPVVYLTSSTEDDILLKAQATKPYGYVLKPIREKQLNGTIMMALSRFYEENKIFKINKHYYYSFEKKSLYYLGEEVDLTKRERDLFDVLSKNIKTAISNKQLKLGIWGEEVPDNTLRSLVRRIRDKLHEDLIENTIAVGYRLKIDTKG